MDTTPTFANCFVYPDHASKRRNGAWFLTLANGHRVFGHKIIVGWEETDAALAEAVRLLGENYRIAVNVDDFAPVGTVGGFALPDDKLVQRRTAKGPVNIGLLVD